MPFHFGFWSNNSGESEKKFPSQPFLNEVVREAFLFCVNHYGNYRTRTGYAGKPLWCLVSRVSPNTLDSCGIQIFPLWKVLESCVMFF